jgi:hypothetical protein
MIMITITIMIMIMIMIIPPSPDYIPTSISRSGVRVRKSSVEVRIRRGCNQEEGMEIIVGSDQIRSDQIRSEGSSNSSSSSSSSSTLVGYSSPSGR